MVCAALWKYITFPYQPSAVPWLWFIPTSPKKRRKGKEEKWWENSNYVLLDWRCTKPSACQPTDLFSGPSTDIALNTQKVGSSLIPRPPSTLRWGSGNETRQDLVICKLCYNLPSTDTHLINVHTAVKYTPGKKDRNTIHAPQVSCLSWNIHKSDGMRVFRGCWSYLIPRIQAFHSRFGLTALKGESGGFSMWYGSTVVKAMRQNLEWVEGQFSKAWVCSG